MCETLGSILRTRSKKGTAGHAVSALGKPRQEDGKLEAILSYTLEPWPPTPTPAKKTNSQIKLSYTTNNIRKIGAYSGNVASVMC